MDTELFIEEFKNSDAGRARIAQRESGRIAERQKWREEIDVAERKYTSTIGELNPEIMKAQRASEELQEKLTAIREELNRLCYQKRIAATIG